MALKAWPWLGGGEEMQKWLTDRHPEKLGCGRLGSLLEKNRSTLEIPSVYHIELNREAGLLHTGEQESRAHVLQLNKETSLASFHRSSLQTVNNLGEKATVDTVSTCCEYPHTYPKSRLRHVPLSLTPEEKAVPFLHGLESLVSLAGLIPDQQHTQDFPHSGLPLPQSLYTRTGMYHARLAQSMPYTLLYTRTVLT